MPMFYAGRNIDTVPWFHFYSFFSFFLVISSSCNTDKNLSTTFIGMMNMPVISASRLKSHIKNAHLICRYRCKI